MVKKTAVKKAVKRAVQKLARAIAIVTIESVIIFAWLFYGLQVATTLR
ncbi:MAG: hypothetical protein J6T10_24140 [Methanobrevibacter sp.]|nr:hypothetical protein [Methanobrevibacter sp.]